MAFEHIDQRIVKAFAVGEHTLLTTIHFAISVPVSIGVRSHNRTVVRQSAEMSLRNPTMNHDPRFVVALRQ